jgi:hypothetical protein
LKTYDSQEKIRNQLHANTSHDVRYTVGVVISGRIKLFVAQQAILDKTWEEYKMKPSLKLVRHFLWIEMQKVQNLEVWLQVQNQVCNQMANVFDGIEVRTQMQTVLEKLVR